MIKEIKRETEYIEFLINNLKEITKDARGKRILDKLDVHLKELQEKINELEE